MSNAVLNEVWQHAPVEGNHLLVLLVLADMADEDHRWAWPSVATICRKARMSRATAYRALSNLVDLGVIEDVPESEWPVAMNRYKSIVRRIRPVEDWVVKGPEGSQIEGSQIETGLMVRDNPKPSTTSTSTNQKTTSSVLDPVPGVEEPEAPAPRTRQRGRKVYEIPSVGGDRSKRETAKQRAQRAAAEEEALDPFKALDLGDDTADDVLPASEESRQPETRTGRRTRSQGPSERLARMFGTVARQSGHGVPGVSNIAALSGTFARWRKDGVEDDQIRQMIETYWTDTFQRRDHLPAWQDFLAQRGALTAQTSKAMKAAEIQADRHDASKW